jgi:hypothetical protein
MFKVAFRALLAAMTLFLVTTAVSAPAEAANPCSPNKILPYSRAIQVCVDRDRFGNPLAYAVFQTPTNAPPDHFWVGLYQCNNSSGPECVLKSANDKFSNSTQPPMYKWKVTTSSKPYSFGHTYKACTSVRPHGVVNYCSDPVT